MAHAVEALAELDPSRRRLLRQRRIEVLTANGFGQALRAHFLPHGAKIGLVRSVSEAVIVKYVLPGLIRECRQVGYRAIHASGLEISLLANQMHGKMGHAIGCFLPDGLINELERGFRSLGPHHFFRDFEKTLLASVSFGKTRAAADFLGRSGPRPGAKRVESRHERRNQEKNRSKSCKGAD